MQQRCGRRAVDAVGRGRVVPLEGFSERLSERRIQGSFSPMKSRLCITAESHATVVLRGMSISESNKQAS